MATENLSLLSKCSLADAMTCVQEKDDPFNKNIFLHRRKQLLGFMTLSGILMCTRSTVTDGAKANICIVLQIKKPFDITEIRLCLPLKKAGTLLYDLFPFGLREALEGTRVFTWHVISEFGGGVKPINKLSRN